MTNLKRLALAVLALPAVAGESRFTLEAQASLVSVAPETRRLVDDHALAGNSFGFSIRGPVQAGILDHRVHLDLLSLQAKAATGMDGPAPKHLSFGWDLIYMKGKASFYFGLMGMRWRQSIDPETGTDFRDTNEAGTVRYLNSGKGTKLGARAGVEYPLSKDFNFFVGFSQTEFNKKYNPAWFNVGVVYRGLKF